MTTLQTADGRLLRASKPAGSGMTLGMGSTFPPMWSNGEREGDDDSWLASYASIYATQPVVAAVVDKLSRRIAALPFDAYQMLADDGSRELVRGDTLDSLIRRPMLRWSTVALNHFVAQSLLVNGNALLAKVRGTDPDAPPEMLWPLDWAFVSAYAPQGGRIEWWSTAQFGGERFIAVNDTVHFAWEAPASQIGISPLAKLGVTIKLEDAAQRYQIASFRNGARPGGVLTLPPNVNVSKEQLALTRATLDSLHRGPDNAFRVGLVAPGAKWEAMSMSAVEAELIQQRRLNREEVGMVYDLAGPLMNDLTHGTYSNVTELNKALYRDVVPPWLALIEQTWQAQVLDLEPAWLDRFVAFDLTDKLKGEPDALAQTLKLQVEAGLITRNEARRILNMAPVKDPTADTLTMNVNNQAPLGGATVPPAPSTGAPPL